MVITAECADRRMLERSPLRLPTGNSQRKHGMHGIGIIRKNNSVISVFNKKTMENRAQQRHRERLGEALREEIAALVEGELGDPRIGLASVTEVHISPDGKTARVFVAASGDDEEARQTLEGLNAARGYIRHELTSRLAVRQAPEIFFVLDRSEQYGGRIDELLHRVEKRKRSS